MAATPAVLYHTNRTQVTFTKDGTYKTLSLSSLGLLQSAATTAVVIEIENTSATTAYTAGARGDGCSQDFAAAVTYNSHVMCVVECSGANNLVQFKAANSALRFWIHAELVGPGAVVHSDASGRSANSQAELSAWYNRVVTLEGSDTPADVEAVLLLVHCDTANASTWGVRSYGSTATKLFSGGQLNRLYWAPCKTAVYLLWSFYQLYSNGKFVEGDPDVVTPYAQFWEIGYVRKGYGFRGVDTIADESPPQATSWTSRATSSQVPAGAEGIFGILRADATNVHGLRAVGSTNPTLGRLDVSIVGSIPAKLDSSDQYQYFDAFATPELWLYAYTLPPLAGRSIEAEVAVAAVIRAAIETGSQIAADLEVVAAVRSAAAVLEQLAAEIAPAPKIRASLEVTPQVDGLAAAGAALEAAIDADGQVDGDLEVGSKIRAPVGAGAWIDAEAEIGPAIRGSANLCSL